MSNSFKQVFLDRLHSIESRAQAIGLTITHLCRTTGISRSTPDRWKKRPPHSVELIDTLDEALQAEEARRAKPTTK